MTEPTTRVEALTIRHRRMRVDALHEVSLTVDTGVTALVGPNGAGKSTLIRALATLDMRYRGIVTVSGHDLGNRVGRRLARASLGYLPQDFRFTPSFQVRELVEYVAWLKEIPAPRRSDAAIQAIEAVGLTERSASPLKSLSGGMLRRAGIAQAIVNRPALLLLDEPTVGLDPAQRVAFRELIRDLGRQTAVLTSTHLIEDVRATADTVVVLDRGRVVFVGTVPELEAHGRPDSPGDSPLERGYAALLAETAALT
ncbi:MAG: ATP-binding cassette domain-containing protein [Microbacterium sp.]